MQTLIKKYNHLLVILSVFLFFSEFALYTYEKEISPISLKHWAFLLLGGAILLLLLDGKNLFSYLKRPLNYWLFMFFLFTMVWGFFSVAIDGTYGENAVEQVNRNLLAVIYIFSFSIILKRTSAFLLAKKLAIFIVLISVGVNMYDFISLDQTIFSPIYGRAAGLYSDPNISATALTMGCIITLRTVPNNWRFAYCMWVFLGILVTQSRGGIGIYCLVLFYFFWKKYFSKKSIFAMGTAFALLVSIIGLRLYNEHKDAFLTKLQGFDHMFERYEQIMNPRASHIKEDTRMKILTIYLNLWIANPIVGQGIGAANYNKKDVFGVGQHHKISSHNQLVNMMVDFGIFGLFLFLTLILALLRYNHTYLFFPESVAFVFAFLLFAMVSHTLLADFYAYFVYAFLARYTAFIGQSTFTIRKLLSNHEEN